MAEQLNSPANSNPAPLLETAWQIGVRLCRDTLWSGDRCNWLGDSMEFASNTWSVAHRSFGPDLYSGTSGIALFLGQLYRLTGERLFRRTAEGALRQAWSRRQNIPPPNRISLYSGWVGIAWARSQLASVLDRPELGDEAKELIGQSSDLELQPHLLDVISGSAGAIPALLELHRLQPRDELLDLVRRHADHLVNTAQRNEHGCSWPSPGIPAKANLTGFSHGAAGIAWALLEAHRVLAIKSYRDTAIGALRYERQWFDAEQQNWLDLRTAESPNAGPDSGPVCALAWCHGAPGIALSRLRAYELLRDEDYRHEAEAALNSTGKTLANAATAGYGNFSLCHGHCGNAEAFLYASEVLRPEYRETALHTARHAIELHSRTEQPWSCGVPNGGETPGLMLGLAGIGYFLLRLCDAEQIPSVVILMAPQKAHARKETNAPVHPSRARSKPLPQARNGNVQRRRRLTAIG